MSLETRIAALKTKLAEKSSLPMADDVQLMEYRDVHETGFIAGADALAEVYRHAGRIETLKQVSTMLRPFYCRWWESEFQKSEAQLEALLKQLEEKV